MRDLVNELSDNLKLDEEGLTPAEKVLVERNLARTKGFLIGAAVVGAGWLAARAYKKFKNRKREEAETEFEPEEGIVD